MELQKSEFRITEIRIQDFRNQKSGLHGSGIREQNDRITEIKFKDNITSLRKDVLVKEGGKEGQNDRMTGGDVTASKNPDNGKC